MKSSAQQEGNGPCARGGTFLGVEDGSIGEMMCCSKT